MALTKDQQALGLMAPMIDELLSAHALGLRHGSMGPRSVVVMNTRAGVISGLTLPDSQRETQLKLEGPPGLGY